MSNLDSVWGSTTADSGFEDDVVPPAGYVGVPRVADVRVGVSKKNEQYFAIELKDDQSGYKWSIYKQLTKGGQPHEGSIKSAKITLRQVGIDVAHPSQLEPMLKSIIGRYYSVEQRQSDRVNQVTGEFYVNTEVVGAASAPTMNVAPAVPSAQQPPQPAPQVQVPHAQVAHFDSAAQAFPAPGVAPQPVAVPVAEVQRSEAIQVPQVPTVPAGVTSNPGPPTFPSAVPGQPATVVPQQPAPGAQFGDTPPWNS